ncbi:hypothetical protein [Smaragdicoccus niigatensis]|uniref:hypothetical protein n=1 Tax=Smaragdicoccus niigatensis TaxID=359359 RepID=UPI000374A0D3|nr:hypothetical protein [Smaragdicoccus niigatensis]
MVHAIFQDMIDRGRLPTFFLLASIVLAFVFIRFSTRMIRAQASWWPGNVSMGGHHIHHVVFGFGFMFAGGFGLIAVANDLGAITACIFASIFGIGSALVLDEFALVLHLRDVYWTEEGRSSVDAVFVAVAFTGLFLLGFHPLGVIADFDTLRHEDHSVVMVAIAAFFFLAQLLLVVVVILKGKLWTGFLGMFFPPVLFIGAVRVSRPDAPWAKKFYAAHPAKQTRAIEREHRLREPMIRRKIQVQEALAGKFGP